MLSILLVFAIITPKAFSAGALPRPVISPSLSRTLWHQETAPHVAPRPGQGGCTTLGFVSCPTPTALRLHLFGIFFVPPTL